MYTQSTLAILASEAILLWKSTSEGPNSFMSPNIAILRFDLDLLSVSKAAETEVGLAL